MPLPGSDEPESLSQEEADSISQEEARQELFGRGPSKTGMEIYEIVAIVVGIVGAAVAFEEIDNWSQWVVLAAIIVTVIGFMIAVNPKRRE
jgi:hypothetical protein